MSLNEKSDPPQTAEDLPDNDSPTHDKTVVVLPTYNEAENLHLLAAELWSLQIPGLTILVVDDNSPDGTGEIADDLSRRKAGGLSVIHQAKRAGLGRAYTTGFKWALKEGADFIIQMDCDFAHSPAYIPEMLTAIQEADVVVGSRYVEGGQLDDSWGVGRYLMSWWANAVYIPLSLNLKVRDATSGFKCWRAAALEGFDLDAINSRGYSFQFEMAYLTEKLGYRVVEIPIHFEDRRIGQSRFTFPYKVEAAFRAWDIRWRYRNFSQPVPLLSARTSDAEPAAEIDGAGDLDRIDKGRNASES